MERKNQTEIITAGMILLLVGIMVGLSEFTGEKEIIFPEITALGVGALLAPKKSWQVSHTRMMALIAGCSFLGWCISVGFKMPLHFKVILAFVSCQLILLYSQTSFAPMISAMVLPVLMGTESLIYPVAAIGLTGLVIISEAILIKAGYKEKTAYRPLPMPDKEDWQQMLIRSLLVSLCVLIFVPRGMKCVVAPPLLVAFTEFSKSSCPCRKKPIQTVVVITSCGLMGMLCRVLLTGTFGLPLTIAALAATLMMVLLLKKSHLYLPPAGALTILPMLLPKEGLIFYPVWLLIGASCFMGMALLFFKDKEKKVVQQKAYEVIG